MSDQVKNPEDRFFHNEAHIYSNTLKIHLLEMVQTSIHNLCFGAKMKHDKKEEKKFDSVPDLCIL